MLGGLVMFDMSRIKRFDLCDLVGRTLRVEKFSIEGAELIIAFDLKTNEAFIIDSKSTAVCLGV